MDISPEVNNSEKGTTPDDIRYGGSNRSESASALSANRQYSMLQCSRGRIQHLGEKSEDSDIEENNALNENNRSSKHESESETENDSLPELPNQDCKVVELSVVHRTSADNPTSQPEKLKKAPQQRKVSVSHCSNKRSVRTAHIYGVRTPKPQDHLARDADKSKLEKDGVAKNSSDEYRRPSPSPTPTRRTHAVSDAAGSCNDRKVSFGIKNQDREVRKFKRATPRQFDAEKVKANIYRNHVGRRNAFDLGKARQRKQKMLRQKQMEAKANGGPVVNDTAADSVGAPPRPKAAVRRQSRSVQASSKTQLPQINTQAVNPPPKVMVLMDHDNTKHYTRKALGISATMGLTNDQIRAFREVFDLFDSNGGGTIDAEELDDTLRSVNICLTRAEIEDVLKMIDKDGNGEIDFPEFLHLMTNTERFLESLADGHEENRIEEANKTVREHLLFDALTEFMKKSALHSMDEIVGYFHTKYKRVQTPHVVNHYAAGARLIGLNEKQLKEHLEKLKATNTDANSLKSPYAQPLHIVTSATNTESLLAKQTAKESASSKRGFIRLKVKLKREGSSTTKDDGIDHHRKETKHSKVEQAVEMINSPDISGQHGWMSQRTEHIEVRLPPMYLKNLKPFDALTAEDLPAIRTYVNKATNEYSRTRRNSEMSKNLRLWKTLDAGFISPPLLREHFRLVFSHYSAIEQNYLI